MLDFHGDMSDGSCSVGGASSDEAMITVPTTNPTPIRRNKRKNFKPRNISYEPEEDDDDDEENSCASAAAVAAAAAEMDIDDDMLTPTMQSDGDDSSSAAAAASAALDLTSSEMSVIHEAKRRRCDSISGQDSAVDLSTSRDGCSSGQPIPQGAAAAAAAAAAYGQSLRTSAALFHSLYQQHLAAAAAPSGAPGIGLIGGEASAMKEYAETTMRELFGIYGLNSSEAETIANNVPMANFATG